MSSWTCALLLFPFWVRLPLPVALLDFYCFDAFTCYRWQKQRSKGRWCHILSWRYNLVLPFGSRPRLISRRKMNKIILPTLRKRDRFQPYQGKYSICYICSRNIHNLLPEVPDQLSELLPPVSRLPFLWIDSDALWWSLGCREWKSCIEEFNEAIAPRGRIVAKYTHLTLLAADVAASSPIPSCFLGNLYLELR